MKPLKRCIRDVGTGGDLDGKTINVDKIGLVQWLPTRIICKIARTQRRSTRYAGLNVRTVQVERECPLCRVWSEVCVVIVLITPWGDRC